MNKSYLLKTAVPLTFLGLTTSSSCKKEDQIEPQDLLIGDWKLISIDEGDGRENAVFETDSLSYFLTMHFMLDGKLENCFHYEYFFSPEDNYSECYGADENEYLLLWKWESVEESLLQLIVENDTININAHFPSDNSMIWDPINFSDEDSAIWEFERVTE